MTRRLIVCALIGLTITLCCAEKPAAPAKKPVACVPAVKNLDRHQEYLEVIKTGKVGELLFLGDSITDAFRSVGGAAMEKHFAKYHPGNFGISGDQTQHVLWRVENGELEGIHPTVIVLMIGTNNLGDQPPADVAAGVRCILDTIGKKLPETKVLLLGIFPRGTLASDPIRDKVKETNGLIAKFDEGKRVKYLDIGAKFLNEKGAIAPQIMPDALHPSAEGYEIWAQAIAPTVEEMVK